MTALSSLEAILFWKLFYDNQGSLCPDLDLPGVSYMFMGLTSTAIKTDFRNYFSSFMRNYSVLTQECSAIDLSG